MKPLIPRLGANRALLGVLVVGVVGFGVGYQLWSRADDSGAQVQVVDTRDGVREAVLNACQQAGKTVAGEVNDLRVEGLFAQATAVCRAAGDSSMRPTYFTLKLAGNTWGMLQQGPEPPSPASNPDPQLPAQFVHGE